MDLKEQDILGDSLATHWYYVTKGRAMRSLLGDFRSNHVLDVGAGSGVFARQLLDARVCRRATCVDPGYEADRVEKHNGAELAFVRYARGERQGLVLMMDVLEHVDDDVALLRQYARELHPDGRVLISVPAFQFLWPGHDAFLGHRRRYTRRMFERTVAGAGLIVERRMVFTFNSVAGLSLFCLARPRTEPGGAAGQPASPAPGRSR
jgi:2-polyprenyl-3-methyl-5-hydroxy-6-metoxy-1,4-benzoquinol methylase